MLCIANNVTINGTKSTTSMEGVKDFQICQVGHDRAQWLVTLTFPHRFDRCHEENNNSFPITVVAYLRNYTTEENSRTAIFLGGRPDTLEQC